MMYQDMPYEFYVHEILTEKVEEMMNDSEQINLDHRLVKNMA